MSGSQKRNVYILGFSLVVVMLGYGMVIPIIPFYMENMGAGGFELGLLVASYALMRLIFGPLWGSLSDRIGRKPVLMIGVFGYAVTMFFFGLATQLWMLFAARILSGILSSATAPTTMAYIGDSTTEEERGGGMGILGAAGGLGTVLGPGLGGWLSKDSLSIPFFIAAAMSLVSVALIFFILPESHPDAARQQTQGKISLVKPAELWKSVRGSLGVLFMLALLLTAGLTCFYGVFGLYALDRYGYGPQEVGVVMMVMGLVSAIGQGGLSGPLTRRFGDTPVMRWSLLAGAAGLLLMLPASNFTLLLLAVGFFMLATALAVPSLTSLTSRLAEQQQGVVMGISNSFMSLGRIIGPLVGGLVFDINLHLPSIGGALMLFAGFVLAWARLEVGTGLERQDLPVGDSSLRPG